MKVYSHIITRADLYRTLADIDDVIVDDSGVREFIARDGTPAFELFLEGYGARHRRARNRRSGTAATWDDYGLWFAQLFKLDPAARISFYNGVGDFLDQTARYIPRGQSAPWLHETIYLELSRLAAREFALARAAVSA